MAAVITNHNMSSVTRWDRDAPVAVSGSLGLDRRLRDCIPIPGGDPR